jgi:mRNA-degrading endonuclease toxin of MazEF toxin-antitoxin module
MCNRQSLIFAILILFPLAAAADRNHHPKGDTVWVIPLTTTIHKEVPTDLHLSPGETGLQEQSSARAEDITTVRKQSLEEPGRDCAG